MKQRFVFIVNCASNAHRAEKLIRNREPELKAMFPDSAIKYIGKNDSIRQLVGSLASDYDVVVACGGDGTIKETANALSGTNTILGVLPIGSGNDFAKSISLTKSFDQNIEILKRGAVKSIDLVRYNDEFFLNTLGIGLDGLTNYYAARYGKIFGKFRYFTAGVMALFTARKFHYSLEAGNKVIEGKSWMIVAANGAVEGGRYLISPNSINDDGICEFNIVQPVYRLRLFIEFIRLSLGFSFSATMVQEIKGDTFSLKLDQPLYAHADGESLEKKTAYTFRLEPQTLPVITG